MHSIDAIGRPGGPGTCTRHRSDDGWAGVVSTAPCWPTAVTGVTTPATGQTDLGRSLLRGA